MRELCNSYALIFMPFVMLCIIKIMNDDFSAIFFSTDWSVASFIMYSQSLGAVTKAVLSNKQTTDGDLYTTYIIKIIFCGVMPSLLLYFYMNTDPSMLAAIGQVLMFFCASWRFFVDGRKVQLLNK